MIATSTNFIAFDTCKALRDRGTGLLVHYEAALDQAVESSPPPFGQAWYGVKYRSVAADPQWFATSLIANSEKEAEGSRKLWELAGRCSIPEIAEAIRQHAIDESRHALLYLAILDLIFPGALDDDAKQYANSLSPRYSQHDFPPDVDKVSIEVVLDELIQMNIGEIRTRIHQLLLRPVAMAYCPEENQMKLTRILDSLMEDETKHIDYTARLIDRLGHELSLELVQAIMTQRVAEFNEITLSEVGEQKFLGE
ncbi:MAG: hypothetical protein ACK6BG_08320 [Cyanobacteriota bacterium]